MMEWAIFCKKRLRIKQEIIVLQIFWQVQYSIEFINLPKGFVFTPAYTTTGTNNNKAEHDGRIYDIVLASNATRMDIDAGLYVAGSQIGKGSIANRAWNDINANGMQDVEEVGVKDIQVTLYAADGTTVLATAKTDGEGEYIFSNFGKRKIFCGI